MSNEILKKILANLRAEMDAMTPDEWTNYIEKLPDNEYKELAESMIYQCRCESQIKLQALEQKLAKAKSALEFYAKEQIYRMDSEGISTATEIECDEGFLARQTLKEIEEEK